MDQRPNCIKFLEEYIGVSLCGLGLGDGFLDITPKPQNETDKLDFIRFKNFCASKTTIKKVSRQLAKE